MPVVWLIPCGSYGPVSYTHLDVYKRQADAVMIDINKVEPNREQPRKKFDEDALIELSESIKPVSYTHLDVYKRQHPSKSIVYTVLFFASCLATFTHSSPDAPESVSCIKSIGLPLPVFV